MTIHPPKQISSLEGLGLGTAKSLELVGDSTGIGTEVWSDLERPWMQGETVIAESGYVWKTKWQAGKPYIITKFFDGNNELIAIYCDVCRPVQVIEGGFAFVDLYLDVWLLIGQEPMILDEDELAEAVKVGYITADESLMARQAADSLLVGLKNDPTLLDF